MTNSKPLQIAVIGYGYWSPKLIRNIHQSPNAELRMICEKDPARHETVRAENPGCEVVEHYREVFARPDIDAVFIATIPSSHYRIAKQALAAGKHVLVEKPLTLIPIEADLLRSIAAKRNLVLMVDHTYLYTPAIRALKERVDAGTLGTIYSFESRRVNLGLFQRDTNVLWDLAPHDISILLYLFKERPTHVSAAGSKTVMHPKQERAQESIAHLMLYYPSFTAHVEVSWNSPIKIRQLTIIGSDRSALYDQLASDPLTIFDQGVYPNTTEDESGPLFLYKTGSAEPVALPAGGEDIGRMVEDFFSAVCEGTTPVSSIDLGVAVVRVLAAADYSLKRGGEKVRLSFAQLPEPLLAFYNAYGNYRHGY